MRIRTLKLSAALFFITLSLPVFSNNISNVVGLINKKWAFFKIWDINKNLMVTYDKFVLSLKSQNDKNKMRIFLNNLSRNRSYRNKFREDLMGLLKDARISVVKKSVNGNTAVIKARIYTASGINSPASFLLCKKRGKWLVYMFILGKDNLEGLQKRYKKMTASILKLKKNNINALIKYLRSAFIS